MFVQISETLHNNIIPLVTLNMGSVLHGDAIPNKSDKDKLILYVDSSYSNLPYEFGLQYKTDNTDYNYVELRIFIRDMLKGEAPIYFEAMFDSRAKYTSSITSMKAVCKLFDTLKWSYGSCVPFNMIKCYTGYMKKDLKRFSSIPVDCYEKRRYAGHILRQYEIVKWLNNSSDNTKFDTRAFKKYIRDIKSFECECPTQDILKNLVDEVISIRESLIKTNEIVHTIGLLSYSNLFFLIEDIISVSNDNDLSMNDEFNMLRWNVLENGVTFQYL